MNSLLVVRNMLNPLAHSEGRRMHRGMSAVGGTGGAEEMLALLCAVCDQGGWPILRRVAEANARFYASGFCRFRASMQMRLCARRLL